MRVQLQSARHNGPQCRCHMLTVKCLFSEVPSVLLTKQLQLLSLLHLLALLVEHLLVALLLLVELGHLNGQLGNARLDVLYVE